MNDSRIRALLAVLVAAIGIGVTITAVDNGPDHQPGQPRRTVTVTLGGPGHHKVTLPPAAQKIERQQATEDARGDSAAAESDLHDTRPPAPHVAAKARALKPPGQPTIPAHIPLATANVPGCTTALVRNYSSRHGAPVLLGFIHWTGSPITAGPAGGQAIVRWFDQAAASASSNEITDQAGRCWLVVPETQKAWTQAGANPWAVSVEIVNPGVQPLFRTPAARRAVLRLMHGWHQRWKIPYRHGRVNTVTCQPIRSGFLAHRDAGPCGGGHPDVGNFNLDGLITEAARTDPGSPKPVTATDRATCRKLTWWRNHGRPHGAPERNAIRRRHALQRRGVTCRNGTAVRRR